MNKQKGFTIIELIVVIAIIAVLAGVVLINVNRYLAKARNVATLSNVSGYVKALAVYYADNGKYPIDSNYYCSLGSPQLPNSYASCADVNAALKPYLSKLSSGYVTDTFAFNGYSYSSSLLPTPNYTIVYRIEGPSQYCGVGTFDSNVNNNTLCRVSN